MRLLSVHVTWIETIQTWGMGVAIQKHHTLKDAHTQEGCVS